MKRENRPLILRLISFTLALIFSLPVNIFAANASINEIKVNANESIDDSGNKLKKSETIIQDNDKERKPGDQDKDNYSLSEIVSIDGNKEKLIYTIKLSKNISNLEDINNRLNIALAINKNQDIKDINVKEVYQLVDGEKKDINYEIKEQKLDEKNKEDKENRDNSLKTFSILTDGFNDSLEFVVEAFIDKDAIDRDNIYNLDLSINIEDTNLSRSSLSYALVENKDGKTELKKKELSDFDFLKAEYIINEDKNSKFDSIIWTDYITGNEDEDNLIYNFNLDEKQITKDSKIKIYFYKKSETGFILDEKLIEEIDFEKEIKLNIPSLYIAKISLETKVSKENISIEKYFLNDKEISNPIFTNEIQIKEETKETVKETKQEIKETKQEIKETVKETSKDTEKEISTETIKESVKETQNEVAGNKEIVSDDKDKNDSKEKAVKEFDELLEKNSKEGENSEEVDKGFIANIFAGLVDFFGQSNLEKADKELKEALADESKTLADIQTLLHELGEKYELNRENQAKLMDDNGDAIKALILKYADENFRPSMLFALNDADKIKLENSKFNILTRFDTSTIVGPIMPGQYFKIHLDNKLTVKDESTLEPIKYNNEIIASPKYNPGDNTITYTITKEIRENLQIPLNIPVDYNTANISPDENGYFTIINRISGMGVSAPKALPEQKVYKDGSLSGKGDSTQLEFITELEYFTETLTRATNENKLIQIAKTYPADSTNSSDQLIRNNYVGWKINIPGIDKSGMDIREIAKDKYDYNNLNFSIYAPKGQSLEDYKVVVEDGEGTSTSYSGSMTEVKGDHYIYSFSIPKEQLTEKGYNIYVVAKAPKKRQNYAVGLKIEPDKNYVLSFKEKFEKEFEEFAKGNPFILKWKDTSAANPYANGIELLDTRMVYLEPNGWQDLFPYNGFRSVDYNDNIADTDILKNTVSMFGNIDENGMITWTISETFPAEKLVNKKAIGIDAYSAKSAGKDLGNPRVQILTPNGSTYDVKELGQVDLATLQENIGARPGTIVNYTYSQQAPNKDEFTTIRLDSGKEASIARKAVLERHPDDIKDTTGLKYLHKVQEHNDGPGYEIALSKDQANTMKAFIPKDLSKNPRYNDPNYIPTGVIVFCLNPGKPEPTKQYGFNGTITRGEWSTAKKDWAEHGKFIAALATANEAKASPLYRMNNKVVNDDYYASLYEYVLRLFWYGQELAEEYQLDEQSYYKIISYNLYYWIAGENYAESFRTRNGYVRDYFSSAEYSYAQELKQRIATGKDWVKVNYDEDIQIFYYGHDKSRSYQNTITGDTKKPAQKGSVTVNKIDQDGNKLAGAYFQLLDADKNPIKTLVTDESGVAKFEDLDYGTYYIKEVQAPKGYIFNGEISKVEVNGEKAHITFNYTNTKNEIEFRKVDEKGLAMAGVVFELRQNGRPVGEQTSDKNGKFSWKELIPGYYEVVEKKVNNPLYSENEGRVVASFRVDENNKIQDKVIYFPNGSSNTDIVNKKNEGKPIGIEFTKVDLNTKNPLEGAEFVLEYRKPGSSIFRELPGSGRRSNSQGKLVWNDLVDGDYRVIETKAPDGNYDTDLNLGEKATFTIEKNANGYYEIKNVTPSNHKITNKEKPEEPKEYFGEFEFTKVDSETKEKLQGVEFTLTSDAPVGPENDKFDYKVSKITDAEGKIKYTNLYPGTYTLKETKQLPGYKENTKTWKVVVDAKGETKVQAEGGGYEIEITGNDTNFRYATVASIKETLEKTDQPDVLKYTIIIKPLEALDTIVFRGDSAKFSGISFNDYIRLYSAPVGKEIVKTYDIKIKNIDNLPRNEDISPIGGFAIRSDFGNERSTSSNPKFKILGNSGPLTITNDKEKPEPANLTIKKVDSQTKEGLEGAKFRIYTTKLDAKNDKYYLQEVTTNEHGYAVFDSPEIMPNITYYVKEIAAPDGYKITSAITEVKSSATEDNTINAEIPNDKNNARFELYKKGSDGEYLEGVKFKLTKKGTDQFVELTTDANGYLFYNKLEPSTTYVLKEIETIQGYTLNNAEATISVDANGKVTVNTNGLAKAKEGEELSLVLVATNIKQPSIDFVKQDIASKNPLFGAEFVLYKDGKEVANSLTSSDKDGNFGFDNLEDGLYIVYETVSPDGYPYNEEKFIVATFNVEKGKVIDLTTNQQYEKEDTDNPDLSKAYPIYNKINEIKFRKVNEDKQALKGAKFKLDRVWDSYDDNGKLQPNRVTVLKDIETLDDGLIVLSATEPGRYQLIETSAPEDYQQIKTDNDEEGEIVAEFTVARGTLDIKNITVGNNYYQNLDEVTQPIEIVNKEKGKGKFQVNKVDGSGSDLTGARFLLKDMESGQYVKTDGSLTTNTADALTNGDATISYVELPTGEYELREFKSPSGYIRTINTWKVVVNEDGKTTITLDGNYDNDVKDKISPETSSKPAHLSLTNKPNEIVFTKVDSKTNKPIKGVEFEIWWDQQGKRNDEGVTYKEYVKIPNPDANPDSKYIFKTDENGKFKLKNLGTGHYKIYETKIPEGYYVSEKPIDNEPIADAQGEFVNEFYVDIDGDIKKNEHGVIDGVDENLITTIKNTPYTGKFRVQKVGENGIDKLEGASFALYKVINGEVDKTKIIEPVALKDSVNNPITGLVEFKDLENGDYLLEETKAPDDYVISKAQWKVSVNNGKVNIHSTDGSGQYTITDGTLTLNVVNEKPKTSEFMIKKVDASNNETALANVKFNLYDSNKTLIKTAETNVSGEIYFTNVPDGTYYLEEILPDTYQAQSKWTTIVVKDGEITFTHKDTSINEDNDTSKLFELFASVMRIFDNPTKEIIMTAEKPEGFDSKNSTSYTIKNYKNPDVKLYKYGIKENTVDKYDTEVLGNVEFVLQRLENNKWIEVSRAKSKDFTGEVKFENLAEGEYRILEPEAPTGYRQPGKDEAVKLFIVKNGKVFTRNSEGKLIEISESNRNNGIVNIRDGEGKIEIVKSGDDGEKLEGVEFELWNYERTEVIATKSTDIDGKIVFDNLNYGRYWLKETKTLPGYILEDTLRPILVSNGNFDIPEGTVGKDVSGQLTINGDNIISTTNSLEEVYPNDAEGLFANVSLKVDKQDNPNTRIKPGDTFYLRVTDNLDLNGIGNAKSKSLEGMYDIVGRFGTLAKAEIIDKRTIKYTFTNYLENRTLSSDIKVSIPVFVDRFAVPNNSTQRFGVKVGSQNSLDNAHEFYFNNAIDVKYFDKYDEETKPFINALPLKVERDTKEFRMLVYLNMARENTYNKRYFFRPSVNLDDVNIKVYNMSNQDELPHSYGVNLGNNYREYDYGSIYANNQLVLNVEPNSNNNVYVLEITGKINSEKAESITTRSWYYANISNSNDSRNYYWDTENKFYSPKLESETERIPTEIEIVNKKNKVEFAKIETPEDEGSEYKYLAGAEFELRKLNAEEKYVPVRDKAIAKSDKNGRFGWNKLAPGKYQVWEIKPAAGYVLPTDYVAEFEVDDNGVIQNQTEVVIENKRGTFPQTGGNGVSKGFGIFGTFIMLAAISYFALSEKDKRKLKL